MYFIVYCRNTLHPVLTNPKYVVLYSPPESPIKSSLRQYYEERSRRKPTEFISSQAKSSPQPRVGRGYSSDGDVEALSDGLSSPESSPGRTTYSKR